MSFKIYVYGTDQGIAETQVFVFSGGGPYNSIEASKQYDGDANNPLEISVPCDAGYTRSVRFRFTLNTGATFVQWTYQIGGVQGDSSDTTLVLTADSDIHIHADTDAGGGGGSSTWLATHAATYENVSTTIDLNPQLRAGDMLVYYVSFANSGTVTFSGGINLYAYISSTSSYFSNTGTPQYVVASDTSGGLTFSISYSVTAGDTYYFWVRCQTIDGSASGSVSIVPPGGGGGGGGDGSVHIYNGSTWVKATPYIYNGSTWVKATPYIYNGSEWVKAK